MTFTKAQLVQFGNMLLKDTDRTVGHGDIADFYELIGEDFAEWDKEEETPQEVNEAEK